MDWKTHTQIRLEGLTVELSEPVLVKRSRWYCWFPSLIRQTDGTLWAVMSAYADIHVSDSVNYLSRSRDGGLTWDEPRVIGDGGLSHVLLSDGSALVLPYYLRLLGNGSVGAPCNVISPKGELSFRASGVTVSGWPRPPRRAGDPGMTSPIAAAASFVFNGQSTRGQDGEYLTTLYGQFDGDTRYSLLLAESSDGFAWRIRSVLAGPDCPLQGSEGPCESALCRLKDGRLMCIFRLASFVSYGQTFSADDGRTWTPAVNISPFSVEPSLATLRGGKILALSGGRSGIFVWFNTDGQGSEWQPVNIVAVHNSARPLADRIDPDSTRCWLNMEQMHKQRLTGFSSCYTELAALDDNTLLLIYDRIGFGWHPIPDDSDETKSVWVIRLRIA